MSENWTTGKCQHCGENLEFDPQHDGTLVPCPDCRRQTVLLKELKNVPPPGYWGEGEIAVTKSGWIPNQIPKFIEDQIDVVATVVFVASIIVAVVCLLCAIQSASDDSWPKSRTPHPPDFRLIPI